MRRYLESYGALFGSVPRTRLLVIAVDHDYWSGGVLRRTISVVAGEPPSDANKGLWVHLFAHELLHLWTTRLRLVEETPGGLEWFKEGFAEYFAYLHELRTGDITEADFLAALGDRYTKYLAARTSGSIRAAGADKFEHYDLVYSGGMMVALSLDLTIRHRTGSARTLHELMAHLYARSADGENAGEPAETLTETALESAVAELYGSEVASLLDRHVNGTALLPVGQVLRHAGLRLDVEGGEEEMTATVSRSQDPTADEQALWAALTAR